MLVFSVYILFCVIVSLVVISDFFKPTIEEAQDIGVVNEFTENKALSIAVFFVILILIAPLVLVVTLIPNFCESATSTLRAEIMRKSFDLK